MNKIFCVYLHRKKTNNKVFYVGKGKGVRPYSKSSRNRHWHHIVNKHGYTVEILKDGLTNKESCDLEIRTIKEYGIENLANITHGGEGSTGRPFSDDALKRIGAASKKRMKKFNPRMDHNCYVFIHESGETFIGTRVDFLNETGVDSRPFFSKSKPYRMVSKWAVFLDGKISNEWEWKRFTSKETREKMSRNTKGRIASEETRMKISKAGKGRKIDPEISKRIGLANKGKFAGVKNYFADLNIYSFTHENGDEFTGTRSALKEKYGVDVKPLFYSKKRKQHTVKGWKLKSPD